MTISPGLGELAAVQKAKLLAEYGNPIVAGGKVLSGKALEDFYLSEKAKTSRYVCWKNRKVESGKKTE